MLGLKSIYVSKMDPWCWRIILRDMGDTVATDTRDNYVTRVSEAAMILCSIVAVYVSHNAL